MPGINFDPTTTKVLEILPRYRVFREKYRLLQKSQWWDKEQIKAYQLQELRKLVKHVYVNVPYYRNVFDQHGLLPGDIRDLSDLERLPYLTKELAHENMATLKARNYAANELEFVATSATSGLSLRFYYERGASRAKEWAFLRSAWGRVGYRFSNKCAVLRGDVIDPYDPTAFAETRLLGRWLTFSSYSMSDEHLFNYVERLRKFKPRYIQAYPSSISLLARFMQELDITYDHALTAVLCSSENISQWQRDLVEAVFRCRVFSWYGQSEQVAFASECEISQQYHISPEYGIVELVDKNGSAITKSGEIGEIVATGFNNSAFPFMRYRTGDLAQYAEGTCECGRHYELLQRIEGRANEFVVDADGHLTPITAIWMYREELAADFEGVRQFQFIQEKPGELILNITPGKDYGTRDPAQMFAGVQDRLGPRTKLIVKLVNIIPRTEAGKHRWLIQKLPVSFGL